MSAYWGYYCPTCEEENSQWLSRDKEMLRQYVTLRALMKRTERQFDKLTIRVDHWDMEDIDNFFDEHGDHDIVLKNGYDHTEQITKEYDW